MFPWEGIWARHPQTCAFADVENVERPDLYDQESLGNHDSCRLIEIDEGPVASSWMAVERCEIKDGEDVEMFESPVLILLSGENTLLTFADGYADGPFERCTETVSREAKDCAAQNGRYYRAGIFQTLSCFLEMPDAGQPCSSALDCEGYCNYPSRTCSDSNIQLGGFEFLDENGDVQSTFVD